MLGCSPALLSPASRRFTCPGCSDPWRAETQVPVHSYSPLLHYLQTRTSFRHSVIKTKAESFLRVPRSFYNKTANHGPGALYAFVPLNVTGQEYE